MIPDLHIHSLLATTDIENNHNRHHLSSIIIIYPIIFINYSIAHKKNI